VESEIPLESPPTIPLPGEAGSRTASPATFSSDELVAGRYKIVRFIGRGGMGEVYEANDLELRQRVALKTVRPEIALDQQAIERFKREIRIAREVTHPNVCRIFDLGHHRRAPSGDEIAFLTMELLPGETLGERLRRTGRMSTAEALPLATQIAAGLAAAHAAGIVHRDLKPGNIILVPSQEGQQTTRAVVTDFGLARAGAAADRLTELSTASGGIAGTPAYMAPEQVESGKVTAASDIYSLGIVLYEIVTGALPFVGDTPLSTAVKRLKEVPPSPRSLVSDLDSKWDAAILRCLERDPADRFASAGDVVKALGGETVTPGRRALRLRLAIAGALLVILFTAAAIYYLRVTRKVQEGARPTVAGLPAAPFKARRSVAVLGFKNLSGRAEASWLSTALSEMLTTELAAGEKLRTIPGENTAQVKINLSLADADSFGKETLARIRANLGSDLVVLGSYLALGKASGGQIRLDLRVQDATAGETIASLTETGTEAGLLDLVARVGARLREKAGAGEISTTEKDAMRAAIPSNPEATRLYAAGLSRLRLFDAPEARVLLQKAVAADPQYPLAHSALAAAWSALGYDARAKEEAKKAFDLSGNLSREERLSVEGRYRETTQDWDKATEIYRTLFNFFPDNLDYGLRVASVATSAGKGKEALVAVEALRKLAAPARDDPRIDLAEAAAARSLSANKQAQAAAAKAAVKGGELGSRLLVARARFEEGSALQNLGELEKAKVALEEAEHMFAAAGDRHGVAGSLNNIALVLISRGDLAGARKICEEALTTYREIGNKSGVALMLSNIGNAHYMQGDLAQAKRMWQETLTAYREIGEKDGVARMLNNIASALADQGDLAGARKSFEAALATYHEIGNQNGAAVALGNIAQLAYTEGDLVGSETMYEQMLATSRATGDRALSVSALLSLGQIFAAHGDLAEARVRDQEALRVSDEIGEKGGVAQSRLALAELSIEDGRAVEAEAQGREAGEEFRRENAVDYEASAHALLARCFLAQGRLLEAQSAMDHATVLLGKSENRGVRFSAAITGARVRAASGKRSDLAEATKSLEATLAQAMKSGFAGYQLEARLALGEIEMKSGNPSAGRDRLEALEKEAKAKGFGLIARKAAAARR